MSQFLASIEAVNNYPIIIKVAIAFFAGLLPVLFWLWFWEHEDKHPEPKKLVFLAFVAGMVGVIIALFLEEVVCIYLNSSCSPVPPTSIFIVWAVIEELVKFTMAYVFVLRRIENDEPIDSMMYMITVALGFAALENIFFLFNLFLFKHALEAFITGNARFVGATLLHTAASGTIGLTLATAFYRGSRVRWLFVTIGVITAIVLHASFNLSIIASSGGLNIIPFYIVWIASAVILIAFEKVKLITQ